MSARDGWDRQLYARRVLEAGNRLTQNTSCAAHITFVSREMRQRRSREEITHRRVQDGADGVDVCAQEEELADLLHDLLVVHVDLARLADDLGDVFRFFYGC